MNHLEERLAGDLGPERLHKIQRIKIGIAGAGGLGSNCAFNLVRSGFRKLAIVDFDRVEPSNLNRQFYFADQIGMAKVAALKDNLLRINPDLELEIHQEKIEPETVASFFKDCAVVVEAFDRVEYKRLLVEHFWNSGKLVVAASGLGGWDDGDLIVTRRLRENIFVVGDGVSEVDQQRPPLSPRVNITAAKQANLILNWALKE
ncbi:MAG: sulfur carrier protein ThiS adenylyltransferase ThiF [Firmicutes bacterium]|nr:sulfur carrier protein ThiS adenylyltransferase ThiF [Bacillota bacterium]